jgi:ADP-heptose:LPS heptosyltransferase
VVCTTNWDSGHPYQYAYGGTSQRQLAAMIAAADLVVGNDSGPVHFGYTIGTRTMALLGGSRKDVFFEHVPELIDLHVPPEVAPCVQCGWEGARGHRASCENLGCSALMALGPRTVADRIIKELS